MNLRFSAVAALVLALAGLAASPATAQVCAGDPANPNIAVDPGGNVTVAGGTCVYVLPGVPVSGRIRTSGTYTITNDGAVTSGSQGILDTTSDTTVDNRGSVVGARQGVLLRDRSTVTNNGTIQGGSGAAVQLRDDGSIVNGSSATIRSTSREGVVGRDRVSVVNDGTIQGVREGIRLRHDATVTNNGLVRSTGREGIQVGNDGRVTNSGTIESRTQGIRGGSRATVTSTGPITSTNNRGIQLGSDATVSSSGAIQSRLQGILVGNDSAVSASGSITSTNSGGIQTGARSAVTSDATVSSRGIGIRVRGSSRVTNTGVVTSTNSAGIRTDANGTVSSSGAIQSRTQGILVGNDSTVSNGAAITSTNHRGIQAGARATVTNSSAVSGRLEGILAGTGSTVWSSGAVTSTAREGVQVGTGSTVTNTGSIVGQQQGVRFGNGGTLVNDGSITSPGSDGAILTRDANVTNTGTITGTSGIRFTNRNNTVTTSGTITGTGGNAVVFNRGTNTLNLQDGAVVNGDVVGGTGNDALVLDGSGSYAGAVRGFESVTRQGSGSWALSGTSVIGGATQISGGTLEMNGDWTTTGLNVDAAAGLAGTGAIHAPATVGGRLSPGTTDGAGLGTLTLDGAVNLAPTTVLEIDVQSGGVSDVVAVTGTADLGGASATVRSSGLLQNGDSFDVLVAAGGVTGGVSDVGLGTSAVLRLTSSVLPDRLRLAVQRSGYASIMGLSRNQRATGSYLDGLVPTASGDLANVMAQLDGLAAPQLADALTQLDAEPYGSATSIAFGSTLSLSNRVSTRLRDRFLGRARPVEDTHAIAASSGAPALVGEGPQGWIDWVGIYGDQDARRDVIGYALDQEGLMLGFDTTVGTRTVLGADAVYLDRNVGFDRSGSRSDGRTLAVGVYGSRALREWSWLEVGIAHAWHHDDVDRALSFADVRRVAHSDRSARQWSVRGGVAGVAALGPLQVVPGVHLLYSQLGEDGFEERDAGALGLDVSSRSTHSLRTLIGFDAESDPLRLGSEGWSLRPDAGVFWVHELLDDERGIRASFVGAPGSFRTLTSQSFDDGLLARAGLSLSWLDRTTFRVGYQLDTDRGGYTQHAVDAGFEVRF